MSEVPLHPPGFFPRDHLAHWYFLKWNPTRKTPTLPHSVRPGFPERPSIAPRCPRLSPTPETPNPTRSIRPSLFRSIIERTASPFSRLERPAISPSTVGCILSLDQSVVFYNAISPRRLGWGFGNGHLTRALGGQYPSEFFQPDDLAHWDFLDRKVFRFTLSFSTGKAFGLLRVCNTLLQTHSKLKVNQKPCPHTNFRFTMSLYQGVL